MDYEIQSNIDISFVRTIFSISSYIIAAFLWSNPTRFAKLIISALSGIELPLTDVVTTNILVIIGQNNH